MENTTATSDHTPGIIPESGATLFRLEVERREALRRRGTIPAGCSEIDDVLLSSGGFERGCVVGVSVEVVGFGILLGLQTIARALVFGQAHSGSSGSPHRESTQRAAIVTTLPTTAILPVLRDIIRSQAQIKFGPGKPEVETELRRCLEGISISRIFDLEGLWEVLREVGGGQVKAAASHRDEDSALVSGGEEEEERQSEVEHAKSNFTNEARSEKDSTTSVPERETDDATDYMPLESTQEAPESSPGPVTELPPLRIGPELRRPVQRTEIFDSEDDEAFSPSPSYPPPSGVARESASPSEGQPDPTSDQYSYPTPSPISSQKSKPESRPRESVEPPSRSATDQTPSPPDIILITHFTSILTTLFTHHDKTDAHTSLQRLSSYLRHIARSTGPLIMLLNTTTSHTPSAHLDAKQQRPLDPTLRSVFNTPHTYGSIPSRRNKPSFGLTFAQLLDLHLLCTKVPRTRDDAEAAIAGVGAEDVCYSWVVEILLDELGARWEGGGIARRVNREMRWAAVDVRGGVRIVDAFGRNTLSR